jgi:hypothetical protein
VRQFSFQGSIASHVSWTLEAARGTARLTGDTADALTRAGDGVDRLTDIVGDPKVPARTRGGSHSHSLSKIARDSRAANILDTAAQQKPRGSGLGSLGVRSIQISRRSAFGA